MHVDIEREPARGSPSRARAMTSRMSALPARPSRPDSCSSAARARARAAPVLQQPQQQARVDAARAGGHHQPLERREAHRGVDGAPVRDAHSDAPAPRWQLTIRSRRASRASSSRRAPRDPRVREPMKAVAAHAPALAPRAPAARTWPRPRAGSRERRCRSTRPPAGSGSASRPPPARRATSAGEAARDRPARPSAATHADVDRTASRKRSPPCTIRCPTASASPRPRASAASSSPRPRSARGAAARRGERSSRSRAARA